MPIIATNPEGCGITLTCLPYGNYYFNSQPTSITSRQIIPDCYTLTGQSKIIGADITILMDLPISHLLPGNIEIYNKSTAHNLNGLK